MSQDANAFMGDSRTSHGDLALAQVLASAPIILYTLDRQGIVTHSEGRGLHALGLAPGEVVGRNVFDLYGDLPEVAANLRRALAGEKFSTVAQVGDAYFEVSYAPLHDAAGKLAGTIGVATDITPRQLAEDALRRAHDELEQRVKSRTRELSLTNVELRREIAERQRAEDELKRERRAMERLLQSHERHRQLIAYEIHDGLVQGLTGALMHLEAGQQRLSPRQTQANPEFALTLRLLRDSIDEARRLISGLRPPILDEFGVIAGIEYLLRELPRDDLEIDFTHDIQFDRLAPLLESTLFRIFQEAINNICQHSQATKARIAIEQFGERVHIEIRDWGKGFDPATVTENRYGLQGIRERARLLRGSATVEGLPGQGTQLIIDLPLTYPLDAGSERGET